MKKKLVAILILIFVITGCGNNVNVTVQDNSSKTVDKSATTNQDNNKNNQTTTLTPPLEQTGKAIYTGEAIDKENSNNTPFLAVIENIKAARPQSGLSQADIVFETLAEGGIPRCMALFQSHKIENIGPIRSDRIYFNEIANAMNLPFAHCGGSQAAIDDISNKHLMSLNEMKNGSSYWRTKSRKMPHNLYTSSEKITALINKKGYNVKPEFNLGFDNNYWNNLPDKAPNIVIRMSGYYTTSYVFKNGRYEKLMNYESVPDKNTGKSLTAKNIIVQFTKISPIAGDKKLRVEVDLTGSGKGYAISNGFYKNILWSKASGASPIKITDVNGNPIKLSAGNTWWEIVDSGTRITFDKQIVNQTTSTKNHKKSKR